MDQDRTSGWKLLSRVVTVAAVTSAVVATGVDYLTRSRATDVRLLELGVQILQENPRGQNRALREWGLELLDRYSDEDLPPELRESLRDSLSFPAAVKSISEAFSQMRKAVSKGPVSVDEQGRITVEGVGRGTVIVRSGESADTAVVDVLPPESADRDSILR